MVAGGEDARAGPIVNHILSKLLIVEVEANASHLFIVPDNSE